MRSVAGVALQTDETSHYIDHLGVLSAILQIPFLFTDEIEWKRACRYYPGLDARLVEWRETSPGRLLEQYDVLFSSICCESQFFQEALEPFKGSKRFLSVYCPHGNSDKGDRDILELYTNHDCVLLYGTHMLDFLKETGVLPQIRRTAIVGNYRRLYYESNKSELDRHVKEEVLQHFAGGKPLLLYCQTWNADFFTTHIPILEHLPDDYNLIVKVHPRMMLDHLGMMLKVIHRYEKRPNILFLTDFPLIYPLLAHVDAYIGDVSSVGYDFLAFDRPMFFLNPYQGLLYPERTLYLYQAGRHLLPEKFGSLFSLIDHDLKDGQKELSGVRKDLYQYAFSRVHSLNEVRSEIFGTLSSSA